MRYAVYRPDTGEILRTGYCGRSAMEAQARTGEAATEVAPDVSDETHRIVDGQAVEKE
ncbi:hypothetical protein FBZ85_11645 [Azospirillum brasilense]|uniref:Uncharacterized protein n=1 Tax=Azospirillum baldaniorum TaxID=1064539 RepID=A0A9P1JTD8_9PROT|nr:hypothetical protein [Azospirillum baldaniorum]TWA73353.1 hypothetical protein FBZ85_11645 [Azospirillum brasilense]CCC99352.1 protein of unknown function [Azospirillum baldaniorum]